MRYLKRLLSSKARLVGRVGTRYSIIIEDDQRCTQILESSLRGLFRVKFAIETPHRKRICYDRF